MSRLSSTRKQEKFVEGIYAHEEVLSFSREDETRSSTKGCVAYRLDLTEKQGIL